MRLRRLALLGLCAGAVMPGCGRTRLSLSMFSETHGPDDGAGTSSSPDSGAPNAGGAFSTGGKAGGGTFGSAGQPGGGMVGAAGEADGGEVGGAGVPGGGMVGAAGEANGGSPGAAGESNGGSPGAAGEANGGGGGQVDECTATPGTPGEVYWLETFGDVGTSLPRALARDSHNDIVIAGDFHTAIDFGDGDALQNPDAGPPNYSSYNQAYLAKFDDQGNTLWSKALLAGAAYGVLITGVALDPDDNIVVAGMFRGNLELDEDAPGQHIIGSDQAHCENNGCNITQDVFVAKYSPDGVLIWGHAYGGDNGESVNDLACDSAGHIVLTGTFRGSIDFSTPNPLDGSGPAGTTSDTLQANNCDAYLATLDSDGTYVWGMNYGITTSKAVCQQTEALAIADNDDILLAGGYIGLLTLSGDAADQLPVVNSQEVLLARFSKDGDHIFSKGWAASSNQYATDIDLADNGEIFMIGYFGGQIPFDVDAPLVSAGSGDVFVAHFDAQGNYQAGKRYGDSFDQRSSELVVDDQGRVTVSGRFSRWIDFGAGTPLETASGAYADYDAFVVQLDSSLTAIWQLKLGPTFHEGATQLAELCDGSPIAAGVYGAGATLSTTGETLPSHGGKDLWLMRVAP
jgi:hypothetical protein